MSLPLAGKTPAHVDRTIVSLRGERVILDADLATLYEVETKTLVRTVKRNADRFPSDFMFQLTADEAANLRYQIGTSRTWGGRRHLPFALELARTLAALEKKYDAQFRVVFDAIRD